jgi:opacity protein-like surface antigen
MHNKFKLISAFIPVALMSLLTISLAQETKTRGGRGYFMTGANRLDLNGLNSTLQINNYPSFPDNLFSLGGGGHAVINQFIIGGEGHGLLTSKKDFTLADRNYKSALEAGYGFFNVGYQIIANSSFSFYPLIGIGGGGITLKISDKTATSFDEILADPGRNVKLTTGGFLLHAALGTENLFVTRENENKRSGFVLGLRAGYIFAPIAGDWHFDGSEIAGGPEIGFTGPYVRLMIGGGGMRRE